MPDLNEAPPADSGSGEPQAVSLPAHTNDTYESSASTFLTAMHGSDGETNDDGPGKPKPKQNLEVTPISADKQAAYQEWLKQNGVTDAGSPEAHYDYQGAFLAGLSKSDNGHFPDTFKQHGHPTFSVESKYSKGLNDGGSWVGETFVPGKKDSSATTTDKNGSFIHDLFTTGIFGGIGHAVAHPLDTYRSIMRGASNAGIEGSRAVATIAGAPFGMDQSKASADKLVAPFESVRDAMFGPKSTNGTDSFVEGTAQFVSGMFGANEIRAVKALPGILRGGVAGGLSQAFAFDPHEKQWSEWAGSSNIPVIQQLGNLSTPSENDGELVSRARRFMGGLIPGVAVDGLLATYGLLKANKVLQSTTATAAEKSVAQEAVARHSKVITDIDAGTHVPETPAIVQQTKDGRWQVFPNDPIIESQRQDVASAGLAQEAPSPFPWAAGEADGPPTGPRGVSSVPPNEPGVPDVLPASPKQRAIADRRIAARDNPLPEGQADRRAVLGDRRALGAEPISQETAQAVLDGHLPKAVVDDAGVMHIEPHPRGAGIQSVEDLNAPIPEHVPMSHAELIGKAQREGAAFDNFGPAKRGWALGDKFVSGESVDQAFGQKMESPFPKRDNRYQAEADAASVNEALAVRFQANTHLSDEQVNGIRGLATQIEEAGSDPDKLAAVYNPDNPHFNFTYMDTPEKSLAVMKAMSVELSPAFERARATGGITWGESMERAREMAGMIPRADMEDFIRQNAATFKNADAFVHLADVQVRDLTAQASKAAAILEQRPLDAVAQNEARLAAQKLIDVAAEVSGSNSGLGRGLNALKNRGALEDVKFAGEDGAVSPPKPQVGQPSVLAKMSPEELRDFMQLFRLSDNPSVLLNTAARVLKPGSTGERLAGGFFQVFYNLMLSHPATWGAIYSGIGAVSLYEDGVRALAGVASRNPALVREAADIIQSRAIFLKQSIQGMGAAMKAGRSVIDPTPIRHAIPTMSDVGISSIADAAANPGKAASAIPGEFINSLGSRPIATMEEFWRVNNTMAKTRADALALVRRDAAAQSLTGDALDQYVKTRTQAIVDASIDPATGASRLPASRQFARFRSLMAPLDDGSFGKKIEAISQEHPIVRAIMPFVRVTFNSADMAFLKNSPLGLFSKDYKAAMDAGGPEAAVMQTRIAVGSTLWGAAGLMAFQGSITGNGPSNPKLRQAWLDDGNQPYSFKIGGEQISYRRLEPFSTILSIAADLGGILRDHGADPSIAEGGAKVFYGALAATADAFANKTYLSSLTKFMDAATSGEGSRMKAFFDQYIAAGVPGEIAAMNNDPYVRQTQGMFDAFVNRVPGWSKSLPAVYNAFGEPRLSTPGRTEKAINPYPIKDQPSEYASAESEQLDLNRTLAVPPTVERQGNITVNLHDPKYRAKDGSTDTPYERWMGYIQDSGLRDKVNKLISSSQYERAGTGTDALVGGRRYDLLNTLVDRTQKEAKLRMLQQYPELKNDLTALQRAARVSKYFDSRGQSILERVR